MLLLVSLAEARQLTVQLETTMPAARGMVAVAVAEMLEGWQRSAVSVLVALRLL
jgi:hypothetical protein